MSFTNLPLVVIDAPSASNTSYPLLSAILGPPTPDSVGPAAANRQPVALDTRTETLRDRVNLIIATLNEMTDELLQRDGTDVGSFMRGDLSMRDADLGINYKVTNVAAGTAAADAVNKSQLDTVEALVASLTAVVAGAVRRDGTVAMTGSLDLGGNSLVNLGTPVDTLDAATKGYVDGQATGLESTFVRLDGANTPMLGGLNMGSQAISGVATPTASTDAATKGYLDALVAGVENAPTGSLAFFAGPEAATPAGWLICDGQQYDKTAGLYTPLFNVIGTQFGGSGVYFQVPDLRGRVIAGRDNMGGFSAGRLSGADTLGAVQGNPEHPLTSSEMPQHKHTITDRIIGPNAGSYWGPTAGNGAFLFDFDAVVHDTGYAGSAIPHNNVQPTMVLNVIIKL